MSDIKDKIRKLLTMAEGQANDNESDQALRMATDLMMKHGIDQAELGPTAAKPTIKEGEHIPAAAKFERYVAAAVNLLYRTKFVSYPDKRIRFVGRMEYVDAAEMTYIHLVLQINAAYKLALPSGLTQKARKVFREDFKEFAAVSIFHRCTEIVKQQTAPESMGTALVLHTEQLAEEIDEYFKGVGVTVRTKKRKTTGRRRPVSTTAARAGTAAGEKAEINKEI